MNLAPKSYLYPQTLTVSFGISTITFKQLLALADFVHRVFGIQKYGLYQRVLKLVY